MTVSLTIEQLAEAVGIPTNIAEEWVREEYLLCHIEDMNRVPVAEIYIGRIIKALMPTFTRLGFYKGDVAAYADAPRSLFEDHARGAHNCEDLKLAINAGMAGNEAWLVVGLKGLLCPSRMRIKGALDRVGAIGTAYQMKRNDPALFPTAIDLREIFAPYDPVET